PRLDWHTLETPNFRVHFHDGLGPLAQRAARAAEAAHRRLVPMLRHRPAGKVDIVLSDETDSANGSATAYLRPVVHLLAVPPDDRSELNDFEDYLWNLVAHEYAHILHLDEVGGVPAVVNTLFGQLWTPNSFQPKWIIEGLAIWSESALSGGGRARSSLYDMYLRTQVLEGGLCGIDEASGSPTTWPRGGTGYLYGARFLDWVRARYGEAVFARMSRNYGGQLVPFGINLTAGEVLGTSWLTLFEQWRAELTIEVEAQVERLRERGLTEYRRLTFSGEQTGEPRFLPDGRLLYVEASGDARAELRILGPGGESRLVRELYTSGTLAVTPDGSSALVSQTLTHDEHCQFEDLFRVDLAEGRLERLTRGARVTEPDAAPDGRSAVVVRRLTGGRTELARLSLLDGSLETLYSAPERSVLYTPRFSPDGKSVAFAEHGARGRDVRVLDLQTKAVADITRDRALDSNPTFDPTGRWLVFTSDRTGVYNLYAHDLERGGTRQITNVLTGAFRPAVSPDGKRLAFVTFSRKGYDVAEMPFEPESWTPAPESSIERPAPPEWETRELYPVRAYRPSESLLPRYWLPLLETDASGPTLAVTTSGSDLVGRHSWALRAGYGLASHAPYGDVSYSARVARPVLSASAGTWIAPIPEAPTRLLERQWFAGASASLPFSGPDWWLSLSVGYDLRYYDPLPVPRRIGSIEAEPFRADHGLAATATARVYWSNAQRFANAISAERGQALSLTVRGAAPQLGSDFSFASVEASATRYLRMPWLDHHALALRLAGGLGVGDLGNRRGFSLGGLAVGNPLLDLLYQRSGAGAALRGYAPGAFSGNRYVLGNAEYRFPLLTVDRGLWTLPLFVRRIHGALGVDVGDAGERFDLRDLKTAVAAEVRTELLLGYNLLTELRVGYARGLSAEGINNFFVTLGSGF
ncbi:MAG: BamA/TamA family outer membrane protein, partial [Myxococcales bacterium]